MSGYTTTPNLGLKKPTSGADDDQWGTHWNQNADAIDAALGSKGVTNVLDYGADPTGVADSTAAFNAACATRKSVYLPKGTYLVTDVVTLKSGQTMFGDNRYSSVIQARAATFNLSAPGIVNLNPADPPSYGDQTTGLRDIQIYCTQPDQPVRANIVPFPPAIVANGTGRFRVNRVRLTSVNVGIDVSGGGTGLIDDLECGALTAGIKWGNTADGVEISHFHFWNFGLPTNSQLWNVFNDGQTIAASFGRIDGLIASDWECYDGRVQLTAAATGWYLFTNLMLDTNSGLDVVNAIFCKVVNVYQVSGSTHTVPPLNVTGGIVELTNYFFAANSATVPLVSISGATTAVRMVNGELRQQNGAQSAVVFTGGKLWLMSSAFTGASMTVPFLSQTSGNLVCTGNAFGTAPTGVGISVASDNSGNLVANNAMSQMTCVFPTTDPVLGTYSYLKGPSVSQLILGGNGAGRGGRVQFAQASSGNVRGWAGFTDDGTAVALTSTIGGTAVVALDCAVVPGTISFRHVGVEYARVTNAGMTASAVTVGLTAGPTLRSGAGVATGTQPKGSLWMRTDGAAGSTLYVSQGAGTWLPVAGV